MTKAGLPKHDEHVQVILTKTIARLNCVHTPRLTRRTGVGGCLGSLLSTPSAPQLLQTLYISEAVNRHLCCLSMLRLSVFVSAQHNLLSPAPRTRRCIVESGQLQQSRVLSVAGLVRNDFGGAPLAAIRHCRGSQYFGGDQRQLEFDRQTCNILCVLAISLSTQVTRSESSIWTGAGSPSCIASTCERCAQQFIHTKSPPST